MDEEDYEALCDISATFSCTEVFKSECECAPRTPKNERATLRPCTRHVRLRRPHNLALGSRAQGPPARPLAGAHRCHTLQCILPRRVPVGFHAVPQASLPDRCDRRRLLLVLCDSARSESRAPPEVVRPRSTCLARAAAACRPAVRAEVHPGRLLHRLYRLPLCQLQHVCPGGLRVPQQPGGLVRQGKEAVECKGRCGETGGARTSKIYSARVQRARETERSRTELRETQSAAAHAHDSAMAHA